MRCHFNQLLNPMLFFLLTLTSTGAQSKPMQNNRSIQRVTENYSAKGLVYPWLNYELKRCNKSGFQEITCDGELESTQDQTAVALFLQTGGIRNMGLAKYGTGSAVLDDGVQAPINWLSIGGSKSDHTGQLKFNFIAGIKYSLRFKIAGVVNNPRIIQLMNLVFYSRKDGSSSVRILNFPIISR